MSSAVEEVRRVQDVRVLVPRARGERSAWLLRLLAGPVRDDAVLAPPAASSDQDDALTLWLLHQVHGRGLVGTDDRWDAAPGTAALRAALERELECRLRERVPASAAVLPDDDGVVGALARVVRDHDGPSLASYVQRRATREQVVDLLRQRALYHLHEADPTSWVVPRLTAGPKAALAEVQYDEYGAGRPERLHHRLFARGLAACGLDDRLGAHADTTLPQVIEQNNALTMIGMRRHLRGAALGHFAAFEATSAVPSSRMARGLRRLGMAPEMAEYYDEHVEADAVHEHLAARGVCGAFVEAEPEQADDVVRGAWWCLDLEARAASALLDRWGAA